MFNDQEIWQRGAGGQHLWPEWQIQWDAEACEGCRAADLPAALLSTPAGLKYFRLSSEGSFGGITGLVLSYSSPAPTSAVFSLKKKRARLSERPTLSADQAHSGQERGQRGGGRGRITPVLLRGFLSAHLALPNTMNVANIAAVGSPSGLHWHLSCHTYCSSEALRTLGSLGRLSRGTGSSSYWSIAGLLKKE